MKNRSGSGQNANNGGQANRGTTQPDPQLSTYPWYYGMISRAECDNGLNERGDDGDFLIRDSETNVTSSFYLFSKLHYLQFA